MVRRSIKFLLACVLVVVGLLVLYVLFPPGPVEAWTDNADFMASTRPGLHRDVLFGRPSLPPRKKPNTETTQLDRRSQWHTGDRLYFNASASTVVRHHHGIRLCVARTHAHRVEWLRPAPLRGGTLRARRRLTDAWCAFFIRPERVRFNHPYLSAQALESIEQRVAAYQSLASRARRLKNSPT